MVEEEILWSARFPSRGRSHELWPADEELPELCRWLEERGSGVVACRSLPLEAFVTAASGSADAHCRADW